MKDLSTELSAIIDGKVIKRVLMARYAAGFGCCVYELHDHFGVGVLDTSNPAHRDWGKMFVFGRYAVSLSYQ